MSIPLVPAMELPDSEGVEFRVIYDGDGYDGEMPARELALAVEAMADFADGVATAASDGQSKVQVKVQATETGSFDIVTIVQTLTGPGIGAAIAVAFQFYWKQMRKRATSTVFLPEHNAWEVTFMGGEVLHFSPEEWAFWNNKRAKKALGRIAAPLRSGAKSVTLTADGGPPLTVEAPDVDRLSSPTVEESKERDYFTTAWPDTVAFDPAKTWRMITRDGPLSATIEDKEFLQNVANGRVRIGVNDVFNLAVRREWVETDDGDEVKVRHFIEKVIRHEPGAEQDELPPENRATTD